MRGVVEVEKNWLEACGLDLQLRLSLMLHTEEDPRGLVLRQ